MAYDPALDKRVIGVRAWAENHEDQYVVDTVEVMTDWEISDQLKFTRSEEGAIKKFKKYLGYEDAPAAQGPREKPVPTTFQGLEDPEYCAVVFQEMDSSHKPKVCPSCFMLIAVGTGACDCTYSKAC